MGLGGPLNLVEGIMRDIASNLIIRFDAAGELCVVSTAGCSVRALLRELECPVLKVSFWLQGRWQ